MNIASFDFDNPPARRDTVCAKWGKMHQLLGVDPADGVAMWVADSDYRTAPCVQDALRAEVDLGMFGYGYDNDGYLAALEWWLRTRHGWAIDTDWVLTTQGLGHAIAQCIDIWTEPGEGVAYFTPVYHEFRLKTQRAGRRPVELPLALVDGRYELDWDAAEAAITEDTRVLLFCSPQNPSGRVWTPDELRAVGAFAECHNLILVSDEVHCDLVYDGHTHVPTDIAAPEYRDRTVTLFAASKTFNLAGLRVGQMIIPDDALRARVADRLTALNYDPTTMGITASRAAYSPAGQDWVRAQMDYLEGNRQLFDTAVNAIPGLRSMALQATYLPWVDFSATGMSQDEMESRVLHEAGLGVAPGHWFGAGGALFCRFNLAMPRAMVAETAERLQTAFADLQ